MRKERKAIYVAFLSYSYHLLGLPHVLTGSGIRHCTVKVKTDIGWHTDEMYQMRFEIGVISAQWLTSRSTLCFDVRADSHVDIRLARDI